MQSLLAVLVIPQQMWPVFAKVLLFLLLLLLLWIGYARAPRISGFGPHVVKMTETFEYPRDGEEVDRPRRTSMTTETQSARTV
jgi:hypothetical protein